MVGSSNYGGRGPKIVTQSLLINTDVECSACKEKGKHRLENCNVFARMLVNARATLCTTTNHYFRFLIRRHYTSKCLRQISRCNECNGPHHTLLHGAERQFLVAHADQGYNPIILLVRAPLPITFDFMMSTWYHKNTRLYGFDPILIRKICDFMILTCNCPHCTRPVFTF